MVVYLSILGIAAIAWAMVLLALIGLIYRGWPEDGATGEVKRKSRRKRSRRSN